MKKIILPEELKDEKEKPKKITGGYDEFCNGIKRPADQGPNGHWECVQNNWSWIED